MASVGGLPQSVLIDSLMQIMELDDDIEYGLDELLKRWTNSGLPFAASLTSSAKNFRSYGVIGDGITDDTVAVQAAIDSLALEGGGTFLIDANMQIRITDEVVFPGAVGCLGEFRENREPYNKSAWLCDGPTAAIKFGVLSTDSEARRPISGNFVVHGNGNCDPEGALQSNLCVENFFLPITVVYAVGTGVRVSQTQNTFFQELNIAGCGGTALVLNGGAGGNLFSVCQIGSSDKSLVIGNDVAIPNAYPFGPSHNEFHHIICETYLETGTSLIEVQCGGNNKFTSCGISANGDVELSSGAQVIVSNPHFPGIGTFCEFNSSNFQGGNNRHTGVVVQTGNNVLFSGETYMQSQDIGVHADGVSFMRNYGRFYFVDVTEPFHETTPLDTFYWASDKNSTDEYNMGSVVTEAIRIKRDTDPISGARLIINRDGGISWIDGTNRTAVAGAALDTADKAVTINNIRLGGTLLRTRLGGTPDGDVTFDTRLANQVDYNLMTLGVNINIIVTNPRDGKLITVGIHTDGNPHTVTWPSDFRFIAGSDPVMTIFKSNYFHFQYLAGAAVWQQIYPTVTVDYA